jgi:hypothetical protein
MITRFLSDFCDEYLVTLYQVEKKWKSIYV